MKEKTLKRKNDLNVNFERRKIYVYSVVYLAVMGLLLAGVLFIFSRRMKGGDGAAGHKYFEGCFAEQRKNY